MSEAEKQKRRTMQLVVALLLFAAAIYAAAFIKLPVWLPVLQ